MSQRNMMRALSKEPILPFAYHKESRKIRFILNDDYNRFLKMRHPAVITQKNEDSIVLLFEEPPMAITPGQSAAF